MAFSVETSSMEELDAQIKQSILQNHRHLAFSSETSRPTFPDQDNSKQAGTPLKGSYEESGPPTPISGPPPNFGKVASGLYRSSFPRPSNFEHLSSLGLKTILTLVSEPYPPDYVEFVGSKEIQHLTISMPAHKDDFDCIPAESMAMALNILLDTSNHPILVHCNKGKHRTGCVIACYRKMHDWTQPKIIAEYRQYAGDKARPLDEKYIGLFDTSAHSNKRSTLEMIEPAPNYLPTPPSSDKCTSPGTTDCPPRPSTSNWTAQML